MPRSRRKSPSDTDADNPARAGGASIGSPHPSHVGEGGTRATGEGTSLLPALTAEPAPEMAVAATVAGVGVGGAVVDAAATVLGGGITPTTGGHRPSTAVATPVLCLYARAGTPLAPLAFPVPLPPSRSPGTCSGNTRGTGSARRSANAGTPCCCCCWEAAKCSRRTQCRFSSPMFTARKRSSRLA